jgi:hypothetical protein
MVGFSMDAGSLRLTIASINAMGLTMPEIAKRALAPAAARLHDEARKNISLKDHSLKDLGDIDHPYARRHGKIDTGALGHEPEWQVHTRPRKLARGKNGQRLAESANQTGDLLRSLRVGLLPSARRPGEAWVVWFDVDAAPHAVFVVQGTPLMLPRDVLWWTATDPRVQKAMMREVVRVLGASLRTQGVVRFGAGGSPKSAPSSPAGVPGNLAV